MSESEAEIVAAWQRGDEQAVRTLFNLHYPRLVRLAVLSGLELEEAQDCAQEAFLRATLEAHAPQSIDLEQSWKTVSQRMTSLDTKSSAATHLRFLPPQSSWQTHRRHKWPIVATVATLLLILLGTGTTGPLFHWFGGSNDSAYAYSDVSQSQQSHSITMTVTKAYADPNRLYMEYHVQLPHALAKRYKHVFPEGAPQNQYMQEKGVATLGQMFVCDDSQHDSWPVPCINLIGGSFQDIGTLGNTGDITFHVPAEVNTLIITWSVKEVLLNGAAYPNTKVSGNWHFQFSFPFHRHPHDPGLPFTNQTMYWVAPVKPGS